jgi:hypothetical protein
MDMIALALALVIVAGASWQVRGWLKQAEARGEVKGYNAALRVQRAREARQSEER